MKLFAKIENGLVTNVSDAEVSAMLLDGVWVETWRDGGVRKNFAGIGYSYDHVLDAFIPPKRYDSWVLDEQTGRWEAPVVEPNDGGSYDWNEAAQEWVALPPIVAG